MRALGTGRRSLPRFLLAALALVLASNCGRGERPARHLVLVVFDTLRADRLSAYGYPSPTTPFLEEVSDQLLRFAAVKAPAPWTVPSHASMFTGLLPAEHGAQWGQIVLDQRFDTLAEILRARGFCTVGLVANRLVGGRTGLAQGFEAFDVVRSGSGGKTEMILRAAPAVLDDALRRRCRLFLFINLMDTHTPYSSARHGRAFGADGGGPAQKAAVKWQINAGVRPFTDRARRLHNAAYDAAVRYLDDVTRALYGLLAERGMLEETLLILTSDHGEGLGQHATIGHSLSVWEEQLAVPLMVRFPRARRGGEVVAQRTSLHALMPSLLDWLAIPRPASLRRAPGLEGIAADPIVADYRSFFAEGNRRTNVRLARRYPELAGRTVHRHVVYCDRYKLIRSAGGSVSFFDLVADPHEQTDLAPGRPPRLRSCLGTYEAVLERGLLTPFDRPGRGGAEEIDPELHETLRALGYLE